ncbi:MAG: MBL fold metallo-hydrolase [candidate division Zixibacteria bacterium]|nr:MBL fold metallo-hydrolase [candidate division Zixibacteria bacterium]
MFFKQIKDPGLAQYAYLIGDKEAGQAIIFDPQRDIEKYLAIAEQNGIKIVAAADTHIHADYISGLRQFAETGVKIYASDEGNDDWKFEWLSGSNYNYQLVKDGDKFSVGQISFEVKHTPGHTPEHTIFIVSELENGQMKEQGIVSGDFVLVGDVGRPDLLETAAGQVGTMRDAAEHLYESIQKFKKISPELMIWPGHGAGSACGKSMGAAPMTSVEQELNYNAAILAASDKKQFVEMILDGQPEPPYYFGRMKIENKNGPAILNELPQPRQISPGEIIEQAKSENSVIVDTREWQDYMRGHLKGALFAPLSDRFETVTGSYLEDGSSVCLIVPENWLNSAVTALTKIGVDNIECFTTPEQLGEFAADGGTLEKAAEIHMSELYKSLASDNSLVLDVRNASELKEEGMIDGACHIAYTRLLTRLNELPKDRHIYVHCRSGQRSAFAVGFLQKHGYQATNVRGFLMDWTGSGGSLVPLK